MSQLLKERRISNIFENFRNLFIYIFIRRRKQQLNINANCSSGTELYNQSLSNKNI